MEKSSMTDGAALSENKAWKFFKQTYERAKLAVLAPAMLVMGTQSSQATDLLASGRADVVATFGADSLVAMAIILAEIIVGVGMYIKTKNLLILLGLAVVIVFTSVGFAYIA